MIDDYGNPQNSAFIVEMRAFSVCLIFYDFYKI